MTKFAFPLLAGLMTACLSLPAAANYSQIIAFGDSLSDNGNLFALAGQPPAPYYNGRFSNGAVAVEVMAGQMGLGLTDFAFGGAQTGMGNYLGAALNGTGVAGQVATYTSLSGGNADASALYVVWAGPNDFFAGTNMFSATTALTASMNLLDHIQALYGLGARDFFVPFMPNLGMTPASYEAESVYPGYQSVAVGQTTAFNSLLSAGLNNLSTTLAGIQIKTFDTAGFMSQQVALANSQGKDTTHRCFYDTVPSVCANPDNYLFWDAVHPTAASHHTLGLAFAAAAAVPEPGTFAMTLAGMLGLYVLALYRRKSLQVRQDV